MANSDDSGQRSTTKESWNPHDLDKTVDGMCDRFEADWNASRPPRIENWIVNAVGPLRDRLTRELVLTDIELQKRHLGNVDVARYKVLFDELPVWLQEAASGLEKSTGSSSASSFAIQRSLSDSTVATSTAGDDRVDPLVGTNLGNYQIIRRIARGGMGVVYEARDLKLDRAVAVKTIVGGALASPEAVRRFHIEAKAAAQIEHAGIVPIHDVSVENEIHYFVMGLVEGESLQTRLERESFTIRESVVLVERISRAVAHAHSAGVVHRDLKPANVLLDKDGQPRITDFGLAKRIDSDVNLTVAGQILGTPGYISPEQAAGKTDVDEAADIYAVGAILYALLTGKPPFLADNYLETLQLVQTETPQSPRDVRREIPRDLETVCLACLAKMPSARYRSAEELADDLRRILNDERVLARPWSTWTRINLWIRRRPALTVTFLTLLPLYTSHLFRFWSRSDFWITGDHQVVASIVATWLLGATIFQQRLLRTHFRMRVMFGWAAFELLMLTVFLAYFTGPKSGYVLGYLLLVTAATLRQSNRLVIFVTVGSLLCYSGLLVDAMLYRPDNRPPHFDHIFMMIISLLVTAAAQHFLLRRTLSRNES